MSIRRAPRPKNNFTIVHNRIFEHGILSFGAMGFLCFLLSKPDNWAVSVPACAKVTQGTRRASGRDAIYGLLDELIAAGYIDRNDLRDEGGKRTGVEYLVHDAPIGRRSKPTAPVTENTEVDPLPGNPDTAKPNPAKADHLIRTDVKQGLNPPLPPKGGNGGGASHAPSAVGEDTFEMFWKAYPAYRRASKAETMTAFVHAMKRTKSFSAIMQGLERHLRHWPESKRHERARIVPTSTTWLNQSRYEIEDEAIATDFTSRTTTKADGRNALMASMVEQMKKG